MQRTGFFSALWLRYSKFLPHLRRATLLLTALPLSLFDLFTFFSYDNESTVTALGEIAQFLAFFYYVYTKSRTVGIAVFSTVLTFVFAAPAVNPLWAWVLSFVIIIDLTVANSKKLAVTQLAVLIFAELMAGYPLSLVFVSTIIWFVVCSAISILVRRAKERLEEMQREAERSKEVAAELIQQLRRDIADSLHDDLAADLTRMLIISRSISLPNGDDRDRLLDLQDRTQQALTHLRLLIHNLAVSQGPPKEEPTLREIVDSSVSTLSQREIVLDADLDGIENIPALHRSEPGRLLVAFIRENILNALKYNAPHDLVSLFVEQEQDTLYISCSSPWREQKIPEEMHGGYGLLALQNRFENAGGTLSSNRIGASWTVLASLPWSEIATPATNARSLMSPPDGAIYA